MGNVSLKVLEKFVNFLFKKGYEPCIYKSVLLFAEAIWPVTGQDLQNTK